MGFIQAFKGALSGTFADQWKDFYVPRSDVTQTAGLFPAVLKSVNSGRGENTKGYDNIISNGSKILVPEGTALITVEDGAVTGCILEAGGYEFKSDDPNSQSLFAGDGLISSTLKSTWEKAKFGGQPGSRQLAFYVNMKPIPNNRFGTTETIYWKDSFLETMAGGLARGTYSIKIVDPLLFVKEFLPASYLEPNSPIFDFQDIDNNVVDQLFHEFVGCLSAAISKFSNSASENDTDTIIYIQSNASDFAKTMAQEVENKCSWASKKGLTIDEGSVNIVINYDEGTKEKYDAASADDIEIRKERKHIDRVETHRGEAYSENMQGMMAAATGEAMQGAATNENGSVGAFMGMGMAQHQGAEVLGAVSNMPKESEENATEKLLEMKKLLDAGAITQEEYDKIKAQLLGL